MFDSMYFPTFILTIKYKGFKFRSSLFGEKWLHYYLNIHFHITVKFIIFMFLGSLQLFKLPIHMFYSFFLWVIFSYPHFKTYFLIVDINHWSIIMLSLFSTYLWFSCHKILILKALIYLHILIISGFPILIEISLALDCIHSLWDYAVKQLLFLYLSYNIFRGFPLMV